MTNSHQIIQDLFNFSHQIRYVAISSNGQLVYEQREQTEDCSSSESDKYEELLVNPALLTLARQRGNIDCGGLRYLIVGYGNFFQLIKEIQGGHISICLDKNVDLTNAPTEIFDFLDSGYPDFFAVEKTCPDVQKTAI